MLITSVLDKNGREYWYMNDGIRNKRVSQQVAQDAIEKQDNAFLARHKNTQTIDKPKSNPKSKITKKNSPSKTSSHSKIKKGSTLKLAKVAKVANLKKVAKGSTLKIAKVAKVEKVKKEHMSQTKKKSVATKIVPKHTNIKIFSIAGNAGSGKSYLCDHWKDKDVATYDLDFVKHGEVGDLIKKAKDEHKKAILFCGLNESHLQNHTDHFAGFHVTKIWREVPVDVWIQRGLLNRGASMDLTKENAPKIHQALKWVNSMAEHYKTHPPTLPNDSFINRITKAKQEEQLLFKHIHDFPEELNLLSQGEIEALVSKMNQSWVNGYSSSLDELISGVGRDRKEKHLRMGYHVIPENQVVPYIENIINS
jgi:hypothetical protein